VEALGSTAEMQRLGDGHEVAHLSDVDHFIPKRYEAVQQSVLDDIDWIG
jgi:hypothetical protein